MAKLGNCRACNKVVSDEATTCPHCGQPSPYDDSREKAVERLKDIFRQRGEIEAIKAARAQMGLGLKEAKDFVDTWIVKAPKEPRSS